MVFWLLVMVTVFGLVLWILSYHNCWGDVLEFIGICAFTFGGILTAATFISLILIRVNAPADIIKHQTEYKTLIYQQQMELEQYNALSTDCANKIIDWNTNLTRNKVYSEDFWIGVFHPNTYVDVDLIDIDTTSK